MFETGRYQEEKGVAACCYVSGTPHNAVAKRSVSRSKMGEDKTFYNLGPEGEEGRVGGEGCVWQQKEGWRPLRLKASAAAEGRSERSIRVPVPRPDLLGLFVAKPPKYEETRDRDAG